VSTHSLQPRQYPSTATWVLIAINVLIWLAMTALGGSTNPDVLIFFGAKDNSLILQGQVWRLVTPIFVHIGLVHLAFNTYAIYVFGSQIERFFGTARFLSLYMLTGIAGVLASFIFSPARSAGASGAIFGLIGTEAAFFYRYRKAFGPGGQQRLYNILIVIGYNLAFTFVAPNIDVWGHLGGLLAGAVLTWGPRAIALGLLARPESPTAQGSRGPTWGLMPDYAIVLTERGPQLVDTNRPRQWTRVVLGTTVLLSVSALLAVSLQAAGG
jgi:membrane associated rhomboid family serine protease